MKQIIVIDDDPAVLDVLDIMLTRAGYAVSCYTGPEVLMNQPFEHPGAIILDKQLSGIDGLEICRHLKSQPSTQKIPIIMTSATMNVQQAAEKAGADEFVEKPFNIKTFIQAVNRLV